METTGILYKSTYLKFDNIHWEKFFYWHDKKTNQALWIEEILGSFQPYLG